VLTLGYRHATSLEARVEAQRNGQVRDLEVVAKLVKALRSSNLGTFSASPVHNVFLLSELDTLSIRNECLTRRAQTKRLRNAYQSGHDGLRQTEQGRLATRPNDRKGNLRMTVTAQYRDLAAKFLDPKLSESERELTARIVADANLDLQRGVQFADAVQPGLVETVLESADRWPTYKQQRETLNELRAFSDGVSARPVVSDSFSTGLSGGLPLVRELAMLETGTENAGSSPLCLASLLAQTLALSTQFLTARYSMQLGALPTLARPNSGIGASPRQKSRSS
jgi:hypothetical protein